MTDSIQNYGPLKCIVVDDLPDEKSPEALVILNHGFGASGGDLAGLGSALLGVQEIARTCRFVFPEAPLDLGPMGMPGGRAWWEINMARLAAMHETNDFALLAKTEPQGMTEATGSLADCIRAAQADCGLADDSTIIGGFSQGAMISTDLVLRQNLQPQAMVLFSGTIVCEEVWQQAAKNVAGCPVLQSHGHEDMVLPYSQAVALQSLLESGNFSVQFESFRGGHEIPNDVLTEFAKLLVSVVKG